ncbi:uncharacterized protein KGF55_001877 [Candida pseudojiufengensis]|uniref:uncharacterized protein n=1 Tax=Candida pseudojiufengensis TaxID=497109 RepID=UPI0022245690|nr:uncharacterized protein KGF55_001877 [Candida pseudojiufengensis]KAI5964807.1 hypothetical protein KGF55_001877 [Candida pseudojiufengensis]
MKFKNLDIIYFILFSLINLVHGEKLAKYDSGLKSRFVNACYYQMVGEVSFCPTEDIGCSCTNKNALATVAGCLYGINKTESQYTRNLNEVCSYYNATVNDDWFQESIGYYLSDAKSADQIENFNMSVPIDIPFILNRTNTEYMQSSYTRFYNNYGHSIDYGSGILGYWLLVLLLGAFTNWFKVFFPNTTKKLTNPAINWWRANVSMPATFGKKRVQEQSFLKFFNFLIPSRFESIVLFLFYCITILVNSINLKGVDGDYIGETKYMSEIRYVADRTGIIATVMMPLVFLFAGRNNFLQWIVGWNYSTFMTYHRHTARVMFALVVIHAVTFTIVFVPYYAESVKETYFKWGIVAGVCGGIIMIQAMLFFRRRWYEIFLFLHISLAVFWVVGTWYHVVELGFIWVFYPTIGVWGLDRVIRLGRLIAFGFPQADVTLLSDETLKVVVPKPSYWKSIPGGHAFIHFLKPTYFYQSHPFTFTDSVDQGSSIILYAKVKGGITRNLYKSLAQQPGRTCKVRVGVEGPYGESTAAKYANTAVFIAGGNGIPGIYSEAVDVAVHSKDGSNRVKLTWIVREWRSLYWFYEELMSLKKVKIETTIYVTQPNSHIFMDEFNNRFTGLERLSIDKPEDSEGLSLEKDDSFKEITKLEETSCDEKTDLDPCHIINTIKSELSHISFKEGRPCIETLIPEELKESSGSVAFVTCGHPIMVDEIRYYCSKNVCNKERKRVDFYEQVQVWA